MCTGDKVCVRKTGNVMIAENLLLGEICAIHFSVYVQRCTITTKYRLRKFKSTGEVVRRALEGPCMYGHKCR